jgi:hypothetical protein
VNEYLQAHGRSQKNQGVELLTRHIGNLQIRVSRVRGKLRRLDRTRGNLLRSVITNC